MRTIAAALLLSACTTPPPEPAERLRTATVEVTVYTNLTTAPPVAGAEVAFVDPDGTGHVVTTGPDGSVILHMAAGGSVTALVPSLPAGNPPFLSTVLDVQDGDAIGLGWPGVDLGAPPSRPPTCASDVLVASYHGADAAGVSGIDLQRVAGGDVQDGAPSGPIGATTQISVSGAPAGTASVHTDLIGPGSGQQWIAENIDGCATRYDVDLSTGILPWVGSTTLAADASSMHTPLVGGGGGDLMFHVVGYMHGGGDVSWTIAGPIAEDTPLPPLPDDLAAYVPSPGESFSQASAWVIDYGRGGYAHVHDDAIGLGMAGDGFGVPAAGRARGSYRIE